jgi:hypothetical protein
MVKSQECAAMRTFYVGRAGAQEVRKSRSRSNLRNLVVFVSCVVAVVAAVPTVLAQDPPPPVPVTVQATVRIEPSTLNLKSKGKWVTCIVELAADSGFDVNDITASTIRLAGSIAPEARPMSIGDSDKNGVPDMMLKFGRQELAALLSGQSGDVSVALSGTLSDGATLIAGSDTIRVLAPKPPKPPKPPKK